MAWVGIKGQKCPKCGSNHTDEVQEPQGTPDLRKIYLKCFNCGEETYVGTYRKVGNSLVKT